MERSYKLKKGLDLKLVGEAPRSMRSVPVSGEYALNPTDFLGITPRLVVKEGDRVLAGSPLFVDKATESINFVSPVSGVVKAIVRGDRRKLLRIVITADSTQESKAFENVDLAKADGERVKKLLLEAGLFGYIRQRPYDVTASPVDQPKAIFISAFSKMPLAADFTYVAEGQEEDFKNGVKALAKIAKVYVGIAPEQQSSKLLPLSDAEVNVFDGPNPSGNVGVQINHVSPINKGETVWTVGAETALLIGRFFRTGKVDLTRRIALAGSEMKECGYVEVMTGAKIADIVKGRLKSETHVRVINGNPLVGSKAGVEDHLGAHVSEICAIPEGDNVNELFGWIAPRLKMFSASRSYFSWLFGKSKAYDLDCRIKGGQRHMIMSCEYERVFPMDIYPSYLIKAIITGDIDRQEALGIYEIAPEDFAVAEFIDSSKLELQRIVREGLDKLRKENA